VQNYPERKGLGYFALGNSFPRSRFGKGGKKKLNGGKMVTVSGTDPPRERLTGLLGEEGEAYKKGKRSLPKIFRGEFHHGPKRKSQGTEIM